MKTTISKEECMSIGHNAWPHLKLIIRDTQVLCDMLIEERSSLELFYPNSDEGIDQQLERICDSLTNLYVQNSQESDLFEVFEHKVFASIGVSRSIIEIIRTINEHKAAFKDAMGGIAETEVTGTEIGCNTFIAHQVFGMARLNYLRAYSKIPVFTRHIKNSDAHTLTLKSISLGIEARKSESTNLDSGVRHYIAPVNRATARYISADTPAIRRFKKFSHPIMYEKTQIKPVIFVQGQKASLNNQTEQQ